MKLVFILLGLATVTLSATAPSLDGHFNNPQAMADNEDQLTDMAHNLQWQIDSEKQLQWGWNVDEYKEFYLTLYHVMYHNGPNQRSSEGSTVYHKEQDDPAGHDSFLWKVRPGDFDLSQSEVFYFLLWQNYTNALHRTGFRSHYFNITVAAASSASASQAPSSTPATQISSSSTTSLEPSSTAPLSSSNVPGGSSSALPAASSVVLSSFTTPSPTPLPEPTSAASSGSPFASNPDHQNLPLALGLGLGVGIPLVLLAGTFVGLRILRPRRAQTPSSMEPEVKPDIKWGDPAPRYSYVVGQGAQSGPVELSNENRISELG